MEQAISKFFVIIVESFITMLLVALLIMGVRHYKEVYDRTYEEEKKISYVEKEPERTTYPFEH